MEDIHVTINETADKVLEKVKNILKEADPSLSPEVIDRAHIVSRKITNVLKPIIPVAALLYILPVSSIEHRSVGTGINWKVYKSSWI